MGLEAHGHHHVSVMCSSVQRDDNSKKSDARGWGQSRGILDSVCVRGWLIHWLISSENCVVKLFFILWFLLYWVTFFCVIFWCTFFAPVLQQMKLLATVIALRCLSTWAVWMLNPTCHHRSCQPNEVEASWVWHLVNKVSHLEPVSF